MRLFLAHHVCASFVTAPTRISDRLDLATARATSVVLFVLVFSATLKPTASESHYWRIGTWMPTPRYSTVQMQGITNARLRSRATAFVSACERVRLRLRTRSPPSLNAFVRTRSLLLTNAFASTHERVGLPTNANAHAFPDDA